MEVCGTDLAHAFFDIDPVNEIFDVGEEDLFRVMSAVEHVVSLYRDRHGFATSKS